jgi:hypothetical protein
VTLGKRWVGNDALGCHALLQIAPAPLTSGSEFSRSDNLPIGGNPLLRKSFCPPLSCFYRFLYLLYLQYPDGFVFSGVLSLADCFQ